MPLCKPISNQFLDRNEVTSLFQYFTQNLYQQKLFIFKNEVFELIQRMKKQSYFPLECRNTTPVRITSGGWDHSRPWAPLLAASRASRPSTLPEGVLSVCYGLIRPRSPHRCTLHRPEMWKKCYLKIWYLRSMTVGTRVTLFHSTHHYFYQRKQ